MGCEDHLIPPLLLSLSISRACLSQQTPSQLLRGLPSPALTSNKNKVHQSPPARTGEAAGEGLEVTTYRDGAFVRGQDALVIILLHSSSLSPEDFLWNEHKTSYFRNKMCFSLKPDSGSFSPNKVFPSWSNWVSSYQ